MNVYTVEEREAQAALELVKALEAKHGWSGVGVAITEDTDAPQREGYRNIKVKVTPPEGKARTYTHQYAIADGLTLPEHIVGMGEPRTETAKAQASERLGANLDKLRDAVKDSDLTRADVEAETQAVQQAKAQPVAVESARQIVKPAAKKAAKRTSGRKK